MCKDKFQFERKKERGRERKTETEKETDRQTERDRARDREEWIKQRIERKEIWWNCTYVSSCS